MEMVIRDILATIGLVSVVVVVSAWATMKWDIMRDKRDGFIYDWQDEEGEWHQTY